MVWFVVFDYFSRKNASCRPYAKDVVNSTYSPLFSTGAPSNVTVAACSLYAKDVVNSARPFPYGVGSLREYVRILRCIRKFLGVFLPVLRTSFSVRLYAAFMHAYAAYRRPQNIEFYSIRQKKTPIFLRMCSFCCIFAAAK